MIYGLLACLGLGLFLDGSRQAYAQSGFDVTKVVADPNTRVFSDGKTTVETYLISALEKQTACCGKDNVYLQVKFDGEGCVTSVRALSGTSECMKKSIEDLLRYVKWIVEDPSKPRPAIFPVKVDIPCNPQKDNNYTPLSAPPGYKTCGQAAPGASESASNPSTPSSSQPSASSTAPEAGGGTRTQPLAGGGTKPAATGPKPAPSNTTPLATQIDKQTPAALRDSSLLNKLQPKELPKPKYVSRGNLNPDSSHVGTILNERGPQFKTPEFVDGRAGMGVFIKTMYRKLGICGVVNVTSELTLEPDGTISAFRIFSANNEKVEQVTPFVLGSMKFRPVAFKQHYILQFKSDVDCAGYPRNNLDQVDYYFTVPTKPARTREPGDRVTGPTDTLESPRDN
jgi:hypothetical protein